MPLPRPPLPRSPRSPRLLLAAASAFLAVVVVLMPESAAASTVVSEAPPEAQWAWPVTAPVVVRAYAAPPTEYGAGHRGIDLAAPIGALVFAPADGVVRFAGVVGIRTVLSIDHPRGVTSSFEPVAPLVAAGATVRRGEAIAVVDGTAGHCEADCLHLGARRNGRYLSPLVLLGGVPRAVLLPLIDPDPDP